MKKTVEIKGTWLSLEVSLNEDVLPNQYKSEKLEELAEQASMFLDAKFAEAGVL